MYLLEKNFPMYYDNSPKMYLNNESYQYNETIINDNSYCSNLMEIFKYNAIQERENDEFSSFKNNNNKKLDEQATNTLTLKTNNTIPNNQELNKKQDLNKEQENYKYVTCKEIQDTLNNGKFSGLIGKFKKNHIIENAEYKLSNKKRKRVNENKNKDDLSFIINIEEKNKRGRKIKEDNQNKNKKNHNKFSEDNIIKKIKAKLLFYSLLFLNKILKRSINDKNRLYQIDYKYINHINKRIDLEMLKMPLKDLFSLDVSTKFQSISEKFNKNVINKIIEKKIKVEDYPTTMFAFNLSLGQWLELFTYKKRINDIIKDYEGLKDVNFTTIEKSLVGVEDLLTKISENNDEEYFSFFTFFLYNYGRWFCIKKGREKKD